MTKYVLVNDKERVKFEKENWVPFGYGNKEHCIILDNFHQALSLWHHIENNKNWIIEKWHSGISERVFPVENHLN